MEFLIRVVINAIAIAVTAALLPGITVVNNDAGTLLIVGLVFGIINALVRPILMVLTCPLIILSLGFFIFVINGCLLSLTSALVHDRLAIDHFGWAIGGGIIMAIVAMVLESVLGVRKKDRPTGREFKSKRARNMFD